MFLSTFKKNAKETERESDSAKERERERFNKRQRYRKSFIYVKYIKKVYADMYE